MTILDFIGKEPEIQTNYFRIRTFVCFSIYVLSLPVKSHCQ